MFYVRTPLPYDTLWFYVYSSYEGDHFTGLLNGYSHVLVQSFKFSKCVFRIFVSHYWL